MKDLSDLKIGFIGAGNMAHAMAKGLQRKFVVRSIDFSSQVVACAPSDRNLSRWRQEFQCSTTHQVEDLFKVYGCNLIFLCVKPGILSSNQNLIPSLDVQLLPKIVISVAAGISISHIKNGLPPQVRVYRIMTNTACALGEGICGICKDVDRSNNETDEQLECMDEIVIDLCSSFGTAEFVDESMMHAITGVGGSGIAFGYTFIQAMADGAVKMGLPRLLATRFAAQTLAGSAAMVLKSGGHPIELRDSVCSPAGTTIQGIHSLEKGSFNSTVMDAVEAATLKSRQLSSPK